MRSGALDAELREKADAGIKALLDGVELTERELLKVLEKHGVKKFEPLGEKFDPNLHQAMFEMPDPSRPAGTVAQVVQPGYMIGERVLRPALVAIAKGGPKAPAEAPANDNAGAPSRGPARRRLTHTRSDWTKLHNRAGLGGHLRPAMMHCGLLV